MTFIHELQKATNFTVTENGAKTNLSTLDPVLDYFALAGAMRDNPSDAQKLFKKAFSADKQLAVRALFYMRDIRGGQGERNVFFNGLKQLAKFDPDAYVSVLKLIPEYGRWSDIFVNGVDEHVIALVKNQLTLDEQAMAENRPVSLMAKWLPSENTSSKETVKNAKELAKGLGLTAKDYRKRVVALRKYIKILEQDMSSGKWGDIDYSKLPSQAFRKHTKAFTRHDGQRFDDFLTKAEAGEVNLNTSTLYTYEVWDAVKRRQEKAANAMWANLPDWTGGRNAIVIADVSASMTWTNNARAMAISVSLALYFAERNQGPFNGYFMTFSDRPQLQKVLGSSLTERMRSIETSTWGGSTNIQAAFDAILEAAVNANATNAEMPSTLYIISDMEFNTATRGNKETNLEAARRKFEAAGYELPHVVFWNVDARNTNVPATMYDNKVTLISGFSQSNFRYAVEGKTAVEFMLDVLNSERYANIVL